MDARYYFGPIGPGFLTRYASPRSVHIHADLGLMASVDELLDKPARGATPDKLALANDYLAFVRGEPPFGSPETLFAAYAEELRRGGDGAAAKRARSLRA